MAQKLRSWLLADAVVYTLAHSRTEEDWWEARVSSIKSVVVEETAKIFLSGPGNESANDIKCQSIIHLI